MPGRRKRHHGAAWAARDIRKLALPTACLTVFILTLAVGTRLGWPGTSPEPVTRPQGVQVTRIIDGDTLVIAGGEHVRILNIDTAEMPPRSRCDAEERLALAAKARLSELTSNAKEISLSSADRDRDRYGRLLRLVRVDGRDAGEVLISEGLAQRWAGHKAHWC